MRKNRTLLVVIAAVVVVVIGALVLSQNAAPAAGKITAITPAEYQSQFVQAGATHLLIDVRTPDEFNSGHIAGAVNISVDTIANRLSEIPHDRPIVVYCHSGNRSKQAAQILAQAGYSDIRDLGGINTWTSQGYPIV